jgi:hypothetical protein
MKNIKLYIAFTVLLVVAILASAQAQESYRLEYKFQKGKTHRYKSLTSSDITQEVQGQEMKMSANSTAIVRLVIDDVSNNRSTVMIVSADPMVARTKNPMMDTTMVLKNMMGKRTKITVDKTGKILSREVIDSVQYESRGMNIRMSQREAIGFIRLPEKELKIGEKWNDSKTDTTEVGTGKMMNTMDVEYTLVGKESKLGHDCLKISYAGKISTNGKINQMGMDIYTEGTGKVSGMLFFDHAQGMLVYDESMADVESTMAVTGQQNMTIPMTTSTKTIRELLEK